MAALGRLSQFRVPRLSVVHADFRDFLSNHDGLTYIDSPYYSSDMQKERVYERRGADNVFREADHADLADLLSERTGWIASNSNDPWVVNRYQDFQQIEVELSYNSRSAQKKREMRETELIIVCPL